MGLTTTVVLMVTLLPLVAGQCSKTGLCTFTCGENKMIDLSSLAQSDNSPLFKDTIDPQGAKSYSFSPCSTFSEGDGCVNVSVCQVDPLDKTSTIPVGTLQSLDITPDGMHLTYNATYNNVTRTAMVNLVCDKSTEKKLAVAGQIAESTTTYSMNLTTKYACAFNPNDHVTSTTVATTEVSNTTAPPAVTTANHSVTVVTTAPMNTTTADNVTVVTTVPSYNVTVVTTEPPSNVTIVTTEPAPVTNVTTPAANTTMVVTSEAPGNASTPAVSTGTAPVTTPQPKTTTHGFASVTRSAGWLVALLAVSVRMAA